MDDGAVGGAPHNAQGHGKGILQVSQARPDLPAITQGNVPLSRHVTVMLAAMLTTHYLRGVVGLMFLMFSGVNLGWCDL